MSALWPSIIAGIAAIIAAALGYRNRQIVVDNKNKLEEIHVLVNARLDDALNHIAELQQIIRGADHIEDVKAALKDELEVNDDAV